MNYTKEQIKALAEQFICHSASRSIEEIEMAGGMLIELLKQCDETDRISARRWQQIHNLQPQSEALHRIASLFNLPAGTDLTTGTIERVKELKAVLEREIPLAAESVLSYLYALNDEAKSRGGMFPQCSDEQGSDSDAIHRVAGLVRFYSNNGRGYPTIDIVRALMLKRATHSGEPAPSFASIVSANGDRCTTCNGEGGWEAAASSTSYFWKECPDCSGVKGACVQQIAESDTQASLSIAGETQTDDVKDAVLKGGAACE